MSPHRERVVRGNIVSEHLVHLFDETESLVATVSEFLYQGWEDGDALLVVARPVNWAAVMPDLESRGCPVAETIASGRLVVLDAATTLATFMVNGDPNAEKFQETVGDLVHRLCANSAAGLTAYGEMVDILASQGNYNGAEQLEALWNELSQKCSFRLLCGYTSANFGDERTSAHLRRICGAHHNAAARENDLLASWLLANRRPKYHLDNQ